MLNGEDAHGSPRHRNQYRAHTRGSSLRARGHPNPVGATPAPPSVAADQRGTNPRADEMRRFGSAAPPAQAPHSQHLPGGCPAPYRAAPPCPRFYCAGTRPRTRPPPYMACPEGAPLGPSPRCPGAGRAGAGSVGGEQGAGAAGALGPESRPRETWTWSARMRQSSKPADSCFRHTSVPPPRVTLQQRDLKFSKKRAEVHHNRF